MPTLKPPRTALGVAGSVVLSGLMYKVNVSLTAVKSARTTISTVCPETAATMLERG